jgi:hypothetical protein
MSTTDLIAVIALIVSSLSFIVSGLTLYFQFFRKTQKLKVTLIKTDVDFSLTDDSEVIFEFAFVNTGNQSAVLLNVELAFQIDKKAVMKPPKQEGYYDSILLNPSSVNLRKYVFVCSKDFIKYLSKNDPSFREIRPNLEFYIIGFDGKRHKKIIPACVVKVEHFKITGFTYLREKLVNLT